MPINTHGAMPGKAASTGLALTTIKDEARVDTRLLAEQLGNAHRHVVAMIDKYADKFRNFNQLRFQTAVGARHQGGGNAAG